MFPAGRAPADRRISREAVMAILAHGPAVSGSESASEGRGQLVLEPALALDGIFRIQLKTR